MNPRKWIVACVSLSVFLLSACGGAVVAPDENLVLPPPPPSLAILFNPPAPLDDDTPARRLEAEILDRTGLSVAVIVVERDADLLARFCQNTTDLPTAAWLGGLAFAVSEARNCGQAALQVARTARTLDEIEALQPDPIPDAPAPDAESADEAGDGSAVADDEAPADPEADGSAGDPEPTEAPDATPQPTPTPTPRATPAPSEALLTGTDARIIVNRALGTTDLTAIRGRAFCRVSFTDLHGWLLPTLLFRTADLDLERDAGEIVDYPDRDALLTALANGDCAMASLEAREFAALPPNNRIAAGAITTANLPFSVLTYPLDIELGVRLALNDAFSDMAGDPDIASQVLFPLLGQDALNPVTPEDFAPLQAFIAASGVDLVALGR